MKIEFIVTDVFNGRNKEGKDYIRFNAAEGIKQVNGLSFPENELEGFFSDDPSLQKLTPGEKILIEITLNKYAKKNPDGSQYKYTNVQSWQVKSIEKA